MIICLAVVFLGYLGFMSGVTYSYEVGELIDSGSSVHNQTVRVHGEIAPGIEQEGLDIQFTITDVTGREASLEISYHGTALDTFKVGNRLVIEWRYTNSGIFEAKSILSKCASKYTPAE